MKLRDITLGMIQDLCKNPMDCTKCPYNKYCPANSDTVPSRWNLTDPPRFNEAQMELLNSFYKIGARVIRLGHDAELMDCVYFYSSANPTEKKQRIGHITDQSLFDALNYGCGETLDLAELLGKDGAE